MNKGKLLILTLFFVSGFQLSGDCFERVLRVSDGRIIDFQQMTEELKKVDLVFVGEVHDNIHHHRAQLSIIKALAESKVPVAIGLEMITATSQNALDLWVKGSLGLGTMVAVYNANWGQPWPWYMNIFKYARERELPMIGLNVSSAITEKVSRHGLTSLTAQERKELPPGAAFDVDEKYRAQLKKTFDAHGQNNKNFDNFCAAQMVWDKTMAFHLVRFLKSNPGRTIVVIAGIEHAAARGIPYQVKTISSAACKIVLPELPGSVDRQNATTADADYLLLE